MKRIFALMLAVVMCLLLVACGNGIDGSYWQYRMMMPNGKTFDYSLSFEDGVVTVDTPNDEQEYSYEITDDNTIVIDGTITYTFEIDGDSLEFNKPFLGTKSYWYK